MKFITVNNVIIIFLYLGTETQSIRNDIPEINEKDYFNINEENNLLNTDIASESPLQQEYNKERNENFQFDTYGNQINDEIKERTKNSIVSKLTVLEKEYSSNDPSEILNNKRRHFDELQFNEPDNEIKQRHKFSRSAKTNLENVFVNGKLDNNYYKKHHYNVDITHPRQLHNKNRSSEIIFDKNIPLTSATFNDNKESAIEIHEFLDVNSDKNNKCKESTNTDSDISCKKDKTKTMIASFENYTGKISQPKLNQACLSIEEQANKNNSKKCSDKSFGILTPFINGRDNRITHNRNIKHLSKTFNNAKRLNSKKLNIENDVQNVADNTHKYDEIFQSGHNSISHDTIEDVHMNEFDPLEKKINSKPYIKVNHDRRLHHLRIRGGNEAEPRIHNIPIHEEGDYYSKYFNRDNTYDRNNNIAKFPKYRANSMLDTNTKYRKQNRYLNEGVKKGYNLKNRLKLSPKTLNIYLENADEKNTHFLKKEKQQINIPNARVIKTLNDTNVTHLFEVDTDNLNSEQNKLQDNMYVRSKSKITHNNKSFYDEARFKNTETDIYSYLPSIDANLHELDDPKKRSILVSQPELSNYFIEHDIEYDNDDKDNNVNSIPIAVDSNEDEKKQFNYDSNNMEELVTEHNLKENLFKKARDKKTSKIAHGENQSSKKLQQSESTNKKKVKQMLSKNVLVDNNIDSKSDNEEEDYDDSKNKKMATELTDFENKGEVRKKETQTVSYPSSKKITDNGKVKLREHVSMRPLEKQCHPPAGPPKFKWSSEDSKLVRDQEYEDTLKGKVAIRIVEVILAKVHKSSKMTYDFGFCKSSKKTGGDDESTCENQNNVLKSQDLKEIMADVEKLSCKSCNQLPPKLKEFLEWLLKVKSVRSVHVKMNPYDERLNCSLGDSAFLFHRFGSLLPFENQAKHQNSPYEPTLNYNLDQINNVQNLLNENDEPENTFNSMEESMSNDVFINREKQLYNEKCKRFAKQNDLNYPNSYPDIIATNKNDYSLFSNGSFNPNYYSYLNDYSNVDNNYDDILNNDKGDLPKETGMQGKQLDSLQEINPGNLNDFQDTYKKFIKDFPYGEIQYKNDLDFNSETTQYSLKDNVQTCKKRNYEKLQLRNLKIDKDPELSISQLKHENIEDDLKEIMNDGSLDKQKNILQETDQQLGFYTPSVFQFPNY